VSLQVELDVQRAMVLAPVIRAAIRRADGRQLVEQAQRSGRYRRPPESWPMAGAEWRRRLDPERAVAPG
jgi:hypothetical protein